MSSHVVQIFKYSSGFHLTSMLKTSSSTNSSTSAAQIVIEFDGVDAGGGAGGKSGESCQKVKESSNVKKSKNRQKSKTSKA